MTPENIPNWFAHQAKAAEEYQLMYVADRTAAPFNAAEFAGVLEQRSSLDVRSCDQVGAYARARVLLLGGGNLGKIIGTNVVTGPDSRSAVTWKLASVHLVATAPAGAGVVAPVARFGEWLKDAIGNQVPPAAKATGEAARAVTDPIIDATKDLTKALVPTELWIAIGVVGVLALLSFTASESRA